MYTVILYKTSNGKEPIKDFIKKLDSKTKAAVFDDLDELEEKGHNIKMPKSKALKNGLFELRTIGQDKITRIFYFFFYERKIILTNGYIKKDTKLDVKELEKARKYKKDFEERERKNK